MTQFSDFPALDQPEHRLGILAMLPEEAILATARVASRNQDLSWLEPMIRGGLLDVDGIQNELGKDSISHVFAWDRRVQSFVEFLKCIAFEPLVHDDLLGIMDPPIPVLVCHSRPGMKSLVGGAIDRTVGSLKAIKEKHPDDSIVKENIAFLVSGMSLLLCAAIAMNLSESVQVIANAYPDSVSKQLPLTTFGTSFPMGSPRGVNASKPESGTINSVGLAIRLSRIECLERLVQGKHEVLQKLGVQESRLGQRSFNLSEMPAVLTPNCTPSMWAHVTSLFFRQTSPWEKDVSGELTWERDTEPGEVEAKKDLALLIDQPICQMLTKNPIDPMVPYIAAMTAIGVYDFDSNRMLPVALKNGHPDLVDRLAANVSDWSLVERLCNGFKSLIYEVALNARKNTYWGRNDQYETAILYFFRNAPAHVQNLIFSCHLEQDPYEHNKTVLRMEPFYSAAMAGLQKVVELYLAHGFDPHQACPSEKGLEQPDTVLDQIERVNPSMADFIRSCAARNRSFDLLDEIEDSTSMVSQP